MRSLSQIILLAIIVILGVFPLKRLWKPAVPSPMKPPHGENFSLACNLCHSPKSWKLDYEIYAFNHDSTNMPLIGQHTKTECRLCHPTLVFSEANSECFQCHNDVHQFTVGQDCNRCHTPYSWLVHNITQIHQQSRFPLVGVHASVDCINCHQSESFLRYDVIGTECYTCHKSEYESTTKPNHILSGFSTNCEECHTIYSNDWSGTGFNHDFFPLTLGHALSDCSLCHKNGQYSGTSNVCVSCHQQDYEATTNPNHLQAGFSTNCTMCHTTNPGWKPASYDHSGFPLTQGHNISDCTKCHINGNYSNTPSDCYSCHQTDYSNTTNPVHANLGFSTSCSDCHTTAPGWKPALYTQHDALSFPIYSGKHKGEWNSCTECHTNASNYKEFTCISCHAHNKTEMDDKHKDETGYSYTSVACLNCHPDGSAKK